MAKRPWTCARHYCLVTTLSNHMLRAQSIVRGCTDAIRRVIVVSHAGKIPWTARVSACQMLTFRTFFISHISAALTIIDSVDPDHRHALAARMLRTAGAASRQTLVD